MNLLLLILIILVGTALVLALGRLLTTLRHQRGSRLVSCPETHQPTAVRVNTIHAALTSLHGRADLQLSACSRWPKREGCGQDCLGEIQSAPDGCLVRAMLVRWYDGKLCTLCGNDVDAIHWYTHEPAFLDFEGRTLEWDDVPVEQLPEVLKTHRPICWNCNIIESVIRKHPERVVFRP